MAGHPGVEPGRRNRWNPHVPGTRGLQPGRHARHRRTRARVPGTGGVHEPLTCEPWLSTADGWRARPTTRGHARICCTAEQVFRVGRTPFGGQLQRKEPIQRRFSVAFNGLAA